MASFDPASFVVPDDRVLSVGELTEAIKDLLEGTFPTVWVAGEISNFSRPQSGHCYLTLKDDQAQIRAVLWRTAAQRVRFDLHDGLQVVCQGNLDVYAPRGSYQLVIQQIEPRGIGALELALRQLRERLAAEGLFEPARKRQLPPFPKRIALVTSPTGAAIRDFLEMLRRRWRGVDVIVVPVRVQGDGAAGEIAAAIRQVNRWPTGVDVLVVGRGGGSLEDLWSFNEEIVVRAIHGSRIPVVSAVGHEIDVTLADLVADVRALTPSDAATRVAPSADDLLAGLQVWKRRLLTALRRKAAAARQQLEALAARRVLRKPFERIHDAQRQLDEWNARACRAMWRRWRQADEQAGVLAARLEGLSPLSVLARGYSLTQRTADGRLLIDATRLSPGDQITTRFARGQATSRVEQVDSSGTEP